MIKACKDCKDRHMGCHASCDRYLREKAEMQAAKAAANRERVLEDIEIERHRRRKK